MQYAVEREAGIAQKKVRQPINTPIILKEYLALNNFEIYYCPRDTYDFEACIECMNRKYEFRFKDFEYGGNPYQLPFVNKKIRKVPKEWPKEDLVSVSLLS